MADYRQFVTEEGELYGSFETYRVEGEGWYWRACWPGCLPDGEPCGPFDTEREAVTNARDDIPEPPEDDERGGRCQ